MPEPKLSKECFFCSKANKTCPIYPQHSKDSCVEYRKVSISEMNMEQLREEFDELSRDQILLALQTREQWREKMLNAKEQFEKSESPFYNGIKILNSI